jgi:hypothetical protein
MSKNDTTSQKYWLMVIELDDLVPRRDASKPNLYIAKTATPPEKRFEIIQKGKKTHWYTNHITQLRSDLAPTKTYKSKEDVKTACSKLIKKLGSQGFTVNRDTRVWNVYVIELDKTAVTNPGEGYVYVGETSRTPEERFKQHIDGAENKRGRLYVHVVKKHGVRLRPDLAPNTKYFDQASSKRAEKEHFELLKSKGFKVKGGR